MPQYNPYTGQYDYSPYEMGIYQGGASDPYTQQLLLLAMAQQQQQEQEGGGSGSGAGEAGGGGGTATALAKLASKYAGKETAGAAATEVGSSTLASSAAENAAWNAAANGATASAAGAGVGATMPATQAAMQGTGAFAANTGANAMSTGAAYTTAAQNAAMNQAAMQSGTAASGTAGGGSSAASTAGTAAWVMAALWAAYNGYKNWDNLKDQGIGFGEMTDEEVDSVFHPDAFGIEQYNPLDEEMKRFSLGHQLTRKLFGSSKDKYELYRGRIGKKLADAGYLGTDDEGRRYVELADGDRFDFQTEGRTFKGQDGQDVRYADQFDESNPLIAQAKGGLNPLVNIMFNGEETIPGFDAGLTNAVLSNANNEQELYANIAHQYKRMGLDQTSATDAINQQEAEGKISKEEADAARVSIYKALDWEGYERDRPKDGSGEARAALQVEHTPGGPSTPGSRAAGAPLPYGEMDRPTPMPTPTPQAQAPELQIQDPQTLYKPTQSAPAAPGGTADTLDLEALAQQYPGLQQENQMSPETQALLRQQGVIV